MPNLSFFESKHEFPTDYYPEEVVEEADDSDDDEYAPSSDDQITSPSPRRPTPPSGRDRPPRSASYRLSPLDPEDFTTLALLSSPRTLTSQETASAPANLVQLGRPPCYLYSEEQHDEFYRWLRTTTWFRNFGNARRASLNVAKIWTAARRKPRPQAWKFWYEGADIETGNPKIICKRCEMTYTHPRHSRKNISSFRHPGSNSCVSAGCITRASIDGAADAKEDSLDRFVDSEVSEPRPARSRGRGTTTISAANDPELDDLLSGSSDLSTPDRLLAEAWASAKLPFSTLANPKFVEFIHHIAPVGYRLPNPKELKRMCIQLMIEEQLASWDP